MTITNHQLIKNSKLDFFLLFFKKPASFINTHTANDSVCD